MQCNTHSSAGDSFKIQYKSSFAFIELVSPTSWKRVASDGIGKDNPSFIITNKLTQLLRAELFERELREFQSALQADHEASQKEIETHSHALTVTEDSLYRYLYRSRQLVPYGFKEGVSVGGDLVFELAEPMRRDVFNKKVMGGVLQLPTFAAETLKLSEPVAKISLRKENPSSGELTKLSQFLLAALTEVFGGDRSSVERQMRQSKVTLAAMKRQDSAATLAGAGPPGMTTDATSLVSVLQQHSDAVSAAGAGSHAHVDPYTEGGVWPENKTAIAKNEFLLAQVNFVKRKCIPEIAAHLRAMTASVVNNTCTLDSVERRFVDLEKKEDVENLFWCVNETYSSDEEASWINSATTLRLAIAFSSVERQQAYSKTSYDYSFPVSGGPGAKWFANNPKAQANGGQEAVFATIFPKKFSVDLFLVQSLDGRRWSGLLENLSGAPFLRREALRSKLQPYLISATDFVEIVRQEQMFAQEDAEIGELAGRNHAMLAARDFEARELSGAAPDIQNMTSLKAMREVGRAEGMGKAVQLFTGESREDGFRGGEKGKMVGPEVVLNTVGEAWTALMLLKNYPHRSVDVEKQVKLKLEKLRVLLCRVETSRTSGEKLVARKRLVLKLSDMNSETLQTENFHLRVPFVEDLCSTERGGLGADIDLGHDNGGLDPLLERLFQLRGTLNEIVTLFQDSITVSERGTENYRGKAHEKFSRDGNADKKKEERAVATLQNNLKTQERVEKENRISDSKYGDLASLALNALAAEGGGLEKFLAMNMRIHAEEEMLARKLGEARRAKHKGNERLEESARELRRFYQVVDPVFYRVVKVRGGERKDTKKSIKAELEERKRDLKAAADRVRAQEIAAQEGQETPQIAGGGTVSSRDRSPPHLSPPLAPTPPIVEPEAPAAAMPARSQASSDASAPISPDGPAPVVRSLYKCFFLGASWTRAIQKKRCEEQEAKSGAGN